MKAKQKSNKINVLKIILLFGTALIICNYSYCQTKKIFYEQEVLSFFIDSVFKKEYFDKRIIYYKPYVNNRPSTLRLPTEFKEYYLEKDSVSSKMVESEINFINTEFNQKAKLTHKKNRNIKIYEYPENNNKINFNRSIRIEIFKRNIVIPNFYFVELIAMSSLKKTYFYFELNKTSGKICRWYKIQYNF